MFEDSEEAREIELMVEENERLTAELKVVQAQLESAEHISALLVRFAHEADDRIESLLQAGRDIKSMLMDLLIFHSPDGGYVLRLPKCKGGYESLLFHEVSEDDDDFYFKFSDLKNARSALFEVIVEKVMKSDLGTETSEDGGQILSN